MWPKAADSEPGCGGRQDSMMTCQSRSKHRAPGLFNCKLESLHDQRRNSDSDSLAGSQAWPEQATWLSEQAPVMTGSLRSLSDSESHRTVTGQFNRYADLGACWNPLLWCENTAFKPAPGITRVSAWARIRGPDPAWR